MIKALCFNMKKIFTYIILYLNILFSSESIIDGYIYDKGGRELYNAEIYIKNTSTGCTSDSSGYFKTSIPLNGDYTLSVTHIGYISQEITINPFNIKTLEIYLEKQILKADKIVVTALGYKSHVKDTPVITHVVTSEEINDSPHNSIRDIIEFVMPNVQRMHDPHGNDRIKIQGLDNKFVVFMVDGNRISGEFAGNIDFSVISTSDIERMEIIRSGMSTLYGSDSMGGLINIITKKNKKPITLNLAYTHESPISKTTSLNLSSNVFNLSYKLGLDYNDSPGYDLTNYSKLSNTIEENIYYKINNSILYEKDNFSIEYLNRYYIKKIKLYTDIFNGETMSPDTTMDYSNPRYTDLMNSINIKYTIKNSLVSLKLLKESYRKSFYFPYYYQQYPYNNTDGKILLSSLPVRYDYSLFFNTNIERHSFYLGIEYTKETYQSFNLISNDGILIEPSIFGNENVKIINEYSMFFTDKFKIFNKEVVLGLRSTKYSSYKWRFIPSISFRQVLYGYNLRLNYSRGYRIPSLKELYYKYEDHAPALYGDSSLTPSLSNYYAISLESRKSLTSSIEFYYNNIKDMIAIIYQDDGAYYSNSNNVNLYGFNINLQKRFSNFLGKTLDVNSVYSYTDGKSNKQQIIEGMSKHTLNLRIKYNISKELNVLLTQKYNSSKTVFVFGTVEKKELESFSIFDALIILKMNKISMKGGLKNIFNYLDPYRENPESKELLTTIDPGRRLYFNIIFSI